MGSGKTKSSTNEVLAIQSLRVLLLEDNEYDSRLIDALLKESRIEAFVLECVSEPQRALELLQEGSFDVCLLDYRLGAHSGMTLLQKVKEERIEVPMILLTAHADFQVDVEAMVKGASDFIDKSNLSGPLLERSIRYAIKQRKMEKQLRLLAEEDAFTGFQNAHAFRKRLHEAIARSGRSKTLIGVIFIDLDGFKGVNDGWGHAVGDEVLLLAAERICKSVRETDIVGRLGGDEFGVILEGLYEAQGATRACNSLVRHLSEAMDTEHGSFQISASVGVSVFPTHGETPEALLQAADQAMYQVKAQGGNGFSFFDPSLSPPAKTPQAS